MNTDIIAGRWPELTHKFKYDWAANKQMNVSGGGGIVTTNSTGYGATGYVNPITTTHEVVSHTIKILYNGSVDLQNRTIRQETIPNFWKEYDVINAADANPAVKESKNKADTLRQYQSISFLCFFFCIPCCLSSPINKQDAKTKQLRNQEIERLALDKLGTEIIRMLIDADKEVTQRIKLIDANGTAQSDKIASMEKEMAKMKELIAQKDSLPPPRG